MLHSKKINYISCVAAFMLADQGYDVWFGNYRGNSYCRSHVKMSPYDAKFWEYR